MQILITNPEEEVEKVTFDCVTFCHRTENRVGRYGQLVLRRTEFWGMWVETSKKQINNKCASPKREMVNQLNA